MGNLLSVGKALEHVGADLRIVRTPAEAQYMDALVLPGVGNFGDGMKHLRNKEFTKFFRDWIWLNRPLLGICLGMQMLMDVSQEAPGVPGLEIIPGGVRRFPESELKVPHIGWNTVTPATGSPMFAGLGENPHFYFVHSYYVAPEASTVVAGQTEYILPFAAAICRGNIWATQFHPEKSQENGLAILRNFVKLVESTPWPVVVPPFG